MELQGRLGTQLWGLWKSLDCFQSSREHFHWLWHTWINLETKLARLQGENLEPAILDRNTCNNPSEKQWDQVKRQCQQKGEWLVHDWHMANKKECKKTLGTQLAESDPTQPLSLGAMPWKEPWHLMVLECNPAHSLLVRWVSSVFPAELHVFIFKIWVEVTSCIVFVGVCICGWGCMCVSHEAWPVCRSLYM